MLEEVGEASGQSPAYRQRHRACVSLAEMIDLGGQLGLRGGDRECCLLP
jgi:hypothetical protein